MQRRLDPNRKNISMQIFGGKMESLATYKVSFQPITLHLLFLFFLRQVTFEKPEPLRIVLKGVANRDPATGITHDFVIVTGFTRKVQRKNNCLSLKTLILYFIVSNRKMVRWDRPNLGERLGRWTSLSAFRMSSLWALPLTRPCSTFARSAGFFDQNEIKVSKYCSRWNIRSRCNSFGIPT